MLLYIFWRAETKRVMVSVMFRPLVMYEYLTAL